MSVSPVTGQEYTTAPSAPTSIHFPYPAINQLTEDQKAFMHYVFTTAMEGGINSWAFVEEYSWSTGGAGAIHIAKTPEPDLDGFYAYISSTEADNEEQEYLDPDTINPNYDPGWGILNDDGVEYPRTLKIDMTVIHRGVGLLLQGIANGQYGDPYLMQFVEQWLTDMESGDSDCISAGMAVELGLFGEVVYC